MTARTYLIYSKPSHAPENAKATLLKKLTLPDPVTIHTLTEHYKERADTHILSILDDIALKDDGQSRFAVYEKLRDGSLVEVCTVHPLPADWQPHPPQTREEICRIMGWPLPEKTYTQETLL